MKITISPFMLLLPLVAPAAFGAEDIYRSTMPDGRVIYGESAFPGAKSVSKVAPPSAKGVTIVTASERERGKPEPYRERGGGVAVLPAEPFTPSHSSPGQLRLGPGQMPKTPSY